MKLTIKPTKQLSKELLDSLSEAKEKCARLLADLKESMKQHAELLKYQETETAKIAAVKREAEGEGVKALTANRKLSEMESAALQTHHQIRRSELRMDPKIRFLQYAAKDLADLHWVAFSRGATQELMQKLTAALRPFFSNEKEASIAAEWASHSLPALASLRTFFNSNPIQSWDAEVLTAGVQALFEACERIAADEALVYWDSEASSVE